MITIQLKEKHLCFVANFLKDLVASTSFETLRELKTKVSGIEDPDQMVSVDVDPEMIIFVYVQMGNMRENLSAQYNGEMEELLKNQLMAMAGQGNQTAIDILTRMSALKTENLSAQDQFTGAGRAWLNQ